MYYVLTPCSQIQWSDPGGEAARKQADDVPSEKNRSDADAKPCWRPSGPAATSSRGARPEYTGPFTWQGSLLESRPVTRRGSRWFMQTGSWIKFFFISVSFQVVRWNYFQALYNNIAYTDRRTHRHLRITATRRNNEEKRFFLSLETILHTLHLILLCISLESDFYRGYFRVEQSPFLIAGESHWSLVKGAGSRCFSHCVMWNVSSWGIPCFVNTYCYCTYYSTRQIFSLTI